jgi:hypothetical protein
MRSVARMILLFACAREQASRPILSSAQCSVRTKFHTGASVTTRRRTLPPAMIVADDDNATGRRKGILKSNVYFESAGPAIHSKSCSARMRRE